MSDRGFSFDSLIKNYQDNKNESESKAKVESLTREHEKNIQKQREKPSPFKNQPEFKRTKSTSDQSI